LVQTVSSSGLLVKNPLISAYISAGWCIERAGRQYIDRRQANPLTGKLRGPPLSLNHCTGNFAAAL
jgi:hypothetical protein